MNDSTVGPAASVAVMGAGSWGTVFAGICADAGEKVVLWARRPSLAEEMATTGRNPTYLGDTPVHPDVRVTADAGEALADATIVVLAVPSHALRPLLEQWRPHVHAGAIAVSLVKGVSPDTHQRASQVIRDAWDLPYGHVVVLSGPNLARECALRLPAATVVAGPESRVTQRVQQACHTSYFRVYTNPDLIGVELGGAVKNPLAIAAGIADGLGHGHNTKATLVTRGLAEMTRLGLALGGNPLTFSGLAGVGDLMATCNSAQSRNRSVGEQLGRGRRLEDITSTMAGTTDSPGVSAPPAGSEGAAPPARPPIGVPEGVRSAPAIVALAADAGIEMPIVEQVVRVVRDGMDPQDMAMHLMGRSPKAEFHGFEEASAV